MSELQIQSEPTNFVLPSGKELKLLDVFRFCYGLTETEVQILMTLLKSGSKMIQDLEQELQLSKASVNRSLNKLLSMGLVKRTKTTEKRYGRPRHIYYALNLEELQSKLVKEIEDCTNSIRNLISTRLTTFPLLT